MFTQKSSGHSKVVAFIVVLAMIMMYTFAFAGVAFASDSDVRVQIKSNNNGQWGPISIEPSDNRLAVKVIYFTSGEKVATAEAIQIISYNPQTDNLENLDFDFGINVIPTSKDLIQYMWVDSYSYSDGTPVYNSETNVTGFLSESGGLLVVKLYDASEPDDETGILTVNKEVWDNGEEIEDDDTIFEFYLDGNSGDRHDFSQSTPGSLELEVGTYVVYEAAKSGYTPETTTQEAIVTTSGAMVTFKNEKNDTLTTPTGILTVNKEVWDNGEEIEDDDTIFEFYLDGNSGDRHDFSQSTPGSLELEVGTYVVHEAAKAGYTTAVTTYAAVLTTSGESVTFINELDDTPRGILTVNKNVWDNGDDISDNTIFQFYLDGDTGNMHNFSESSPGSLQLPIGSYVVHEAAKAGYTTAVTTYAAVLTTSGESVTFINEKNDPADDGFDIEVEKTVDDTRVYRNETVTFTVTVTNNGPDTAYEVNITDLLPEGLELVESLVTRGTPWTAGSWYIGELESGDSETLTIEAIVTAPVGTVITNTAVWDGQDTIDNSNNEDSASTTVIRRTPNDDDEEDIPEDPIPEGPVEEPPVVIPEIDPPLADVPQTGDTTNTPLLALLMIGSLGGLAALTRKKKIEESDNN